MAKYGGNAEMRIDDHRAASMAVLAFGLPASPIDRPVHGSVPRSHTTHHSQRKVTTK